MKNWCTYNPYIIKKLLNDIRINKSEVLIWQTQVNENTKPVIDTEQSHSRDKYTAKVIEANSENCTLEFKDDNQIKLLNIDPNHTLYFHTKDGNLLFKRDHFNIIEQQGKITFPTPLELHIIEKRKVKRFTYKYSDFKNVSLQFDTEKDKPTHERITFNETLVDISIEGVGIVVNKEREEKFDFETKVFFTQISDQVLPGAHEAEVRYVRPYMDSSGEVSKDLLKVGLKFTQSLQAVTYKSISSFIEKTQSKYKNRPGVFGGLTEQEQDKALVKIGRRDRREMFEIRENVEYLEKLRFMTLEMKQKFFTYINLEVLCRALRLGSKDLIYDLLDGLSSSMKEEIQLKLNNQYTIQVIKKSQDELVKVIRQKEKESELVLDAKSYNTFV